MSATKNTIFLFRAESIGEDHPPKLTIKVHEQIGEIRPHDSEMALYNRQGARLAEALLQSLPVGTVDVLLVELMRLRAPLLAVPLVVLNGD